jgi:hypothetical protein
MATQFAFGKIVTDGLVLALDAADKNSYPGSGTTWTDLSQFNNTGSLINTPTFDTSNGGNFQFATNDYVILPENSALNNQTISIELWFKTNATSQNGMIFEKGQLNAQYNLFQEGSSLFWRQRLTTTAVLNLSITTSTYISTTKWTHLVATFVSGDIRLYVNGVLANSGTSTGTIATDLNGISIGTWGGFTTRPADGRGYYFNGSIAVLKAYSKVLSQNEILQNYNAQKSRFNL